MDELTKRVEKIEDRNERVEADKRWETSIFRRFLIASLTYIIIFIFLIMIDAEKPALGAVVPSIGYILSTIIVTPLKSWWLSK